MAGEAGDGPQSAVHCPRQCQLDSYSGIVENNPEVAKYVSFYFSQLEALDSQLFYIAA
jgi:hypothetical protein